MRSLSVLFALCSLTPLIAADVNFDTQVRPILSENCVFCHGPDEDERQADLRLDSEEGAMMVIERFDHAQSDLYDRITTDDADLQMPPPDSNRKLTKAQMDVIRQWIDEGAKWEKHWSFRPIKKPEIPEQVNPTKEAPIRNPIDSFVRARLRDEPLSPSPAADRRTLIRRLSLDLTGLPPSPAAVEAFVNDPRDKAYERLVDQLLDSPAYGQRMAWDWLDAARYADTNGYQGDRERTMWPWRDWVVRAFNENLPYDQFTIWQLAGDQLPDATIEQKLATGFCRNHMINGEGGRIAEENRVEYVMDMSETMGTVWLGLTLNCCRCHDHKYDPLTNEEYYQFFAFFNQTPVTGAGGDPQTAPNLAVPDSQQRTKLDELQKNIAQKDQELRKLAASLAKMRPDWEAKRSEELQTASSWKILNPESYAAQHQRMRLLGDKSLLTSGPNPDNDTYTIVSATDLETVTGLRIEALRHESMTARGIARSDSGNFVLTDLEVALIDPKNEEQRIPIKITSGSATFEQGSLKIENVFDDDPKSGWAVYQGRPLDRDHTAVLSFVKPVSVPKGMLLECILRHDSRFAKHNLGRFRLSLTSSDKPQISSENDSLIAALKVPAKERSAEQKRTITKAHHDSDPSYRKVAKQRESLVGEKTRLTKRIPKVMVMQDAEKPRQSFVLSRGLYNKPSGEVFREFPAFLPSPPKSGEPTDRLALAKWLVHDDNPLTARVTVNRLWNQFFGIGLVKTIEDFGRQGEIPVQMDLLNWLAADFRENGWDVKQLIRTMVNSHTYRQSSKASAEAIEHDPKNRLLARGSRFRMPSWMLRDQALTVSGLLSPVASGPSVNTYQPAGIWEEASFGKKKYTQDTGEKLYRRSLYTFWRRIIAPTMFFDNPSRQICTVKSSRTNTPLHALQTLNNMAFVEASRALAELSLKSGSKETPARIQWLMNRVIARDATESELKILAVGLERTRNQFTAAPEAATQLLAVGESMRDESLDTVEHASWTVLCLGLLNLDETLNRE